VTMLSHASKSCDANKEQGNVERCELRDEIEDTVPGVERKRGGREIWNSVYVLP